MRAVSGKFFVLATMPLAIFLISGCADQSLADLEYGPNDQIATFDVIDGM